MELLLGTRNPGKIAEITHILGDIAGLELLTFESVPFGDVAETGETFLENARLKASQIATETGRPVLAEDAGLQVDALDGAPGVYTARFAGEQASDDANIDKLLSELDGVENRAARFVCVAVLHIGVDHGEAVAEGELRGEIATTKRGESGFGYDPVFVPEGHQATLAELGDGVKSEISHRRRALDEVGRELVRLSSSAADDGGYSSSSSS